MSSPNLPSTTPYRETHVYRSIDGCDIKADVVGARSGTKKPCVVWIHGGGLIFGSRTVSPRDTFLQALLQCGFVVVTIDHRLAPETKLPAILTDIECAWRWIVEEGSKQFGIDTRRVAMAGASAGAYLTLIGGYSLSPKPRALASFWGFGDITAAWEAEPSPFYLQSPLVSKEAAANSVGSASISEPSPDRDRGYFYVYCRQQGRWLHEVTGHDPRADTEWFDAYCPIRNISSDYPPTVLVHGNEDTDVPHQESQNLALRFKEVGLEHRFISLDGVGHGFANARAHDIEQTEAAVAAFLEAHVH